MLNASFTISEIQKTIASLPINKSPGPYGYFSKCYQNYTDILTPILQRVFQAAAPSASFPSEMLQATVITLSKPGKESDKAQHFRPISLLNVDLKVYAKLLANRIAQLLPSLVKPDQVGFVEGRQATDATRRILNLIHLASGDRQPCHWMLKKTFIGYIGAILSKFGFTGQIFSTITALYSGPSAHVFTVGLFSEQFAITNRTRQGCPLSPLIFALMMEPLAERIGT